MAFGLDDALMLMSLAKGGADLFGGRGRDRAVVPRDLRGLRGQNIDMLRAFLSPGAFDVGGAGSNFFFSGARQQGIDQFLSQPSPELQAFNTARPLLEGMLTGTGPQFERDIASANQQGGRFSSGNAILRGEALRNLFNMRGQTAQTLGVLAGQAGSSTFDRLMQAQAQRLQLLAGLFGMSNQATMGLPVAQGRDIFGDLLKAGVAWSGGRGNDATPAGDYGWGNGGIFGSQ